MASFGHFFCYKGNQAEDGVGALGSQKGLKMSLGRRVLLNLDWREQKVQRAPMETA